MKEWQKAIVNAAIMGGITFLSVIGTSGIITVQSIEAGLVSFGITFFTLLGRFYRPPKTDVNDDPMDVEAVGRNASGGSDWKSLLGALWV